MNGTSAAYISRWRAIEPVGEPLQHLDEHLVDRTEVVVHEALVGASLRGEPARADPRVSDLDEQALGRVQQPLCGLTSRGVLRGW